MDTRILLLKCLYEAKNPSLCRSFAVITCGNVSPLFQPPELLSFLKISSDFDCLSLGYFLSWVCRTIEGETSVSIENINDTGTKFLMKGLVKGIREAKSCGDGNPAIAGSLCIQLYFATWKDRGMRYLAQALQASEAYCISGLELFSCQFEEEDFKHLIEALASNDSLQALCLEHHLFTLESSLALSKMLKNNSTLKKLSLSSVPQATDTGIFTHLAEGLKHNRTIEDIKLSGFRVLPDDIVHLVRCNNTLRRFDLKDFAPSEHGLELLATALTINTTLETLSYSEDKISKKALPALAERLWASGVLRQLLSITIERTVELFGKQETMTALSKYC